MKDISPLPPIEKTEFLFCDLLDMQSRGNLTI